jgi:hypothetical protein
MDRKTRTLSDADIASARTVTRRTLLAALGLGTGVVAATLSGAATHAQTKRRDPCRDGDHGPPSDGDGCGKPPTS